MPAKRRSGKAVHATASSSRNSNNATSQPKQQRQQQQRQRGSASSSNNSSSGGGCDSVKAPRVVVTESLLATDAEKHATSRSLYGDATARIASNVPQIHDHVRLRAYEALLRGVRGKTVLHLGCGMGLYAMLAARHGAALVVAVDTSAIVEPAREVARANGLLHSVVFLRGRLCDVLPQLPTRTFDVVLCEWMGALLLNERLLTDVLYARDHLLREGGVVCPNRSSLHVVGVSDYAFRLETEEFWSNVYGFTMHPMKALVRREVEVCAVPASSIATNTCLAHTVDIAALPGLDADECARYEATATAAASHAQADKTDDDNNGGSGSGSGSGSATAQADNPVEQQWVPSRVAQDGFVASFALLATRATTLHYLTFYIDATFTSSADRGANFVLGIRPGGQNAWTEASVSLHTPLPVAAGEQVTGTLRVHTPAEGGGKRTVVHVTARTQGIVAAVETSGEYVYQAY